MVLAAAIAIAVLGPVSSATAGGNEDYRLEAPQAAAPAPSYGSPASPAYRPPPRGSSFAGPSGGRDPVMDALGLQTIVVGGSTPSGVDVDMSVLNDLGGTLPPSAPRAPTGLRPPGSRRIAAPAAPAAPAPQAPQLDASLVPPAPAPSAPAPAPAVTPPPAPAVTTPADTAPVAPAVAEPSGPPRPRTIAMIELGTRLTDAGEAPLPSPAPVAAPATPAAVPTVVAETPPAEEAPAPAAPAPEPATPQAPAPEPPAPPAEPPAPENPVTEAPPAPEPTPVTEAPPAEPAPIASDSGGRPMELAALPAPAPASGNLPPAATAVGIVRFDTTSDVLNDNAKAALERFAEQLKDPQGRVLIRGFASGLNDTATGARRLALHRIQAVRTFLIEKGVPAGRIDLRAVGMASDAPVADGVDIALLP